MNVVKYCHVCVALDRVLIWILDLLATVTLVYTAITDLHTLQITVTHTLVFSVFARRFLVTASNSGYSSASVIKSSPNGSSLPAL
jgi:hypothetical protein